MKIIQLNLNGERMPKQVKDSPINRSTNARIQAWKDKKAKEGTNITFSAKQDEENQKKFRLKYEYSDDPDTQRYPKDEITFSSLMSLTGSTNHHYNSLFINQAAGAMLDQQNCLTESDATLNINALQGGIVSMDPQDPIEAQLCAKLVVLQSKSMYFMNRATASTLQKQMDSNLNNATKCMRLHNETLEALNRYRRKGEQRVKVVHQYVQVNEGGRAVVAAEARGGGKQKKHKV